MRGVCWGLCLQCSATADRNASQLTCSPAWLEAILGPFLLTLTAGNFADNLNLPPILGGNIMRR